MADIYSEILIYFGALYKKKFEWLPLRKAPFMYLSYRYKYYKPGFNKDGTPWNLKIT